MGKSSRVAGPTQSFRVLASAAQTGPEDSEEIHQDAKSFPNGMTLKEFSV